MYPYKAQLTTDEATLNFKLASAVATTPNILYTSHKVGSDEYPMKFRMDEIWAKYHFHSDPDFSMKIGNCWEKYWKFEKVMEQYPEKPYQGD